MIPIWWVCLLDPFASKVGSRPRLLIIIYLCSCTLPSKVTEFVHWPAMSLSEPMIFPTLFSERAIQWTISRQSRRSRLGQGPTSFQVWSSLRFGVAPRGIPFSYRGQWPLPRGQSLYIVCVAWGIPLDIECVCDRMIDWTILHIEGLSCSFCK